MKPDGRLILYRAGDYELLSDGTVRRFDGSYHNDVYYNEIGNIHTDNDVLKDFLDRVNRDGGDFVRNELKKVLGVK